MNHCASLTAGYQSEVKAIQQFWKMSEVFVKFAQSFRSNSSDLYGQKGTNTIEHAG